MAKAPKERPDQITFVAHLEKMPSDSVLERQVANWVASVTPEMAREYITDALARGWDPSSKGTFR